MGQSDVMQLASLGPFILRARDCVAAMLSNARYILQELPAVPMDDLLRQRTRTACALLIGARHDLIKELFDLDDRGAEGAADSEIVERVRRIVDWAREDVTPIVELAGRVDRAVGSTGEVALVGILLLESAGNIAIAFNAMQEAADELLRDLQATPSRDPAVRRTAVAQTFDPSADRLAQRPQCHPAHE